MVKSLAIPWTYIPTSGGWKGLISLAMCYLMLGPMRFAGKAYNLLMIFGIIGLGTLSNGLELLWEWNCLHVVNFGTKQWRLTSEELTSLWFHFITMCPLPPHRQWITKHIFWDCIQARRACRWATFIMHKLIGLRYSNYDEHSLEASP